MHEKNIETLREEATRLLQYGGELLEAMERNRGIVVEPKRDEPQIFDLESTRVRIDEMHSEQGKVEQLEMVLAVVGTMKAGKSTTINAIVGAEVLPNRNRPMTALPTLIRHTPGQAVPVLRLNHTGPINTLMHTHAEAAAHSDYREAIRGLQDDKDMTALLQFVKTGDEFQQCYEGADEIFRFLKSLNDLVRLAGEFGIDFPFGSYSRIEAIPVIEVEFGHLRGKADFQGRLALLDTPGPNEAGQTHLRKMLREQLRNASAILAVLDFTQLKSDADAELRKELVDIDGARTYALVNKFDQRDRNGDTEDDVRALVAGKLLPELVRLDDVFPVSSKRGYLANRARTELVAKGRLPDHKKEGWVEDFATEAMGSSWDEDDLADSEKVESAAEKLWKKSNFQTLLTDVIEYAHARAAALAIDSASQKLIKLTGDVSNFLDIRKTGLAQDAEKLHAQINAIVEDIEKIGKLEQNAQKATDDALANMAGTVDERFIMSEKDVGAVIEKYFQEGKMAEREEAEARGPRARRARNRLMQPARAPEEAKPATRNWFRAMLGFESDRGGNTDFNPDKETIQFDDASKAQELMETIRARVEEVMAHAEQDMQDDLMQLIEDFKKRFSDHVEAPAHMIIGDINKRLGDDGFVVKLEIPMIALDTIEFSSGEMLADAIQHKTRRVTRQRRSSGAWGTVCSWFNTSDWGWEDYSVSVEYAEISLKTVKGMVGERIKDSFNGLAARIHESVKEPVTMATDKFFAAFKDEVQKIRGTLMQSERDQQRSKAEKDRLIEDLVLLMRNVPAAREDSEELYRETQHWLSDALEEQA
ncbi:dynamin family protein [Burkholderia vietnamiensis]|uniref:dynamin family protein n=1 Tax=Burkholderia vietnamiensis TaxID=60552 RepID=UPI001B9599D4|nr:dynamin family protein [Burkholderia vietnamiensis]MBR8016357.1 dynamin family protein [Burkholderia vietnamiensis]HDR9198188.1 dynamin family protein [Burkholderia vietnamiensis]